MQKIFFFKLTGDNEDTIKRRKKKKVKKKNFPELKNTNFHTSRSHQALATGHSLGVPQ